MSARSGMRLGGLHLDVPGTTLSGKNPADAQLIHHHIYTSQPWLVLGDRDTPILKPKVHILEACMDLPKSPGFILFLSRVHGTRPLSHPHRRIRRAALILREKGRPHELNSLCSLPAVRAHMRVALVIESF